MTGSWLDVQFCCQKFYTASSEFERGDAFLAKLEYIVLRG